MNLAYHLWHYHEEKYAHLCSKIQIPLSTSKPKKKEQIQMDYFTKDLYTWSSQHYESCKNTVMECIWKDMEPLSTINNIPFSAATNSGSMVPAFLSRSHFTQVLLPVKYESVKASITDSLSNTNCCSLMTNMWTGCHSHSSIAVTTHNISDD